MKNGEHTWAQKMWVVGGHPWPAKKGPPPVGGKVLETPSGTSSKTETSMEKMRILK